MSLFSRLFYNFELEDKTSIILKDMYKLILFTQPKWKINKENETSIKRKKREKFCWSFQNLTNNQNETIKLRKHWQVYQLNIWLSMFYYKVTILKH
jgi:hypothetical protein